MWLKASVFRSFGEARLKQILGHEEPLHPVQGTHLCPAVTQDRKAKGHPSTESQYHLLLTMFLLLCGQGTVSPSCSLGVI